MVWVPRPERFGDVRTKEPVRPMPLAEATQDRHYLSIRDHIAARIAARG